MDALHSAGPALVALSLHETCPVVKAHREKDVHLNPLSHQPLDSFLGEVSTCYR